MLKSRDILDLHDETLQFWYSGRPASMESGDNLRSVILNNHFCNFTLWGLEDEVRRTDESDSYIVSIKRSIDKYNLSRNNWVEKIDELILEQFRTIDCADAELHSETAGMMIDRLSILSLKIWHVGKQAQHSESDKTKLEILKTQRNDLAYCFDGLIEDFRRGRRYFKLYRQFKLYKAPDT